MFPKNDPNIEALSKGEAIYPGGRAPRKRSNTLIVVLAAMVIMATFAAGMLCGFAPLFFVVSCLCFVGLGIYIVVSLVGSAFKKERKHVEDELGMSFAHFRTRLGYSGSVYEDDGYQQHTHYRIKDVAFGPYLANLGWTPLPFTSPASEIFGADSDRRIYIHDREVSFDGVQNGYYKLVDLDASCGSSVPFQQREHIRAALGVYDADERELIFVHYES